MILCIFSENVIMIFNTLIINWFSKVTNFFVSSLSSLLQNKLFWSSNLSFSIVKPISLQTNSTCFGVIIATSLIDLKKDSLLFNKFL